MPQCGHQLALCTMELGLWENSSKYIHLYNMKIRSYIVTFTLLGTSSDKDLLQIGYIYGVAMVRRN